MLGRNSGVGNRLKNDYPNIILWHCINHRLQLILDDSVNEIKQANLFKIFPDKIYTTADSDTVSTYQVSSVQLVTNKS